VHCCTTSSRYALWLRVDCAQVGGFKESSAMQLSFLQKRNACASPPPLWAALASSRAATVPRARVAAALSADCLRCGTDWRDCGHCAAS
jgi:hypothetical protein